MFYIVYLLLLFSLGFQNHSGSRAVGKQTNPIKLTIETGHTHQTIHNFGASDAWSIQFVGKNWPLEKRNEISDLLFSTDMDSTGKPKGIGLSLWRFNIGAGSTRQGNGSGISNTWHRTESFLGADSTYDWSKQQGQQWFLRAAKKRGVKQFIGFLNSPPVLLTKNHKAFGDGSGNANIASDNYPAFADYMARIADHFRKMGAPLDYISPFNEPQWNWSKNNGQEGSPYQNDQIAAVVKDLDKRIRKYQLNTKIEIPEAAKIDFLMKRNLTGRSQQASYFFGNASEVKNLPTLAQKLSAHSYFTTWPVNKMINLREKLWQYIQSVNPQLEYWMTEYCILANNKLIHGSGRNLGIDPAMYIARLIHYDLTQANASSWQWWLAVSPFDFKDGLVYIDKNKQNGQFYQSKMLWALGNYSRFVRPGAIRLTVDRSDGLTPDEAATQIMVSAYIQKENKKINVVVINFSNSDRSIEMNINGIKSSKLSAFTPYITSSDYNLKPLSSVSQDQTVTIPARSIITFTTHYSD